MCSEIAIAGQLGSPAPHPVDEAVEREGYRFDRFRLQIERTRNRPQGSFVPPAEMIRRRIEHKIRDLVSGGVRLGTTMQSRPPGLTHFYQIAGKVQRVGHVLDGVKGADGVVFFGM